MMLDLIHFDAQQNMDHIALDMQDQIPVVRGTALVKNGFSEPKTGRGSSFGSCNSCEEDVSPHACHVGRRKRCNAGLDDTLTHVLK
jgi:hypothetical protein